MPAVSETQPHSRAASRAEADEEAEDKDDDDSGESTEGDALMGEKA